MEDGLITEENREHGSQLKSVDNNPGERCW